MAEKTYSITELTDLTDVTERTVRYYITLGLLPKPEGVGRWSHYTEEHLKRLTLIRKLQEGHMPLSEIGEFIKALDEQEAEAKAAQRRGFGEKFRKKGKGEKAGAEKTEPEVDEEAQGASDEEAAEARWWSFDPQEIADSILQQVRGAAAGAAEFVPKRERPASAETVEVGQRTRWERIVLAPGVELNVKVTRSGKQKAAVEALIERARELYADEERSSGDVA